MQIRETKKQKKTFQELIYQYRHAWVLAYFIMYIPWFAWLEQTVTKKFHIITMPADLKIPFCEYFIIPYLLWFAYVAFGVMYFFFRSKEDYYKLCAFLFTGMTLFLMVSTIYPNGHLLRPASFERHNIFTFAISVLYRTDTATNIFPSLHVYNSLGAHIAIVNNQKLGQNKCIRGGSFLLMVSIILSTMFLKQHSVLDVIAGTLLGVLMEQLVYHTDFAFARSGRRKPAGA